MAGLAVAGLPRPLHALETGSRVDPVRRVDTDPAVRDLAMRAIDAAKAAGATYADVRLTRTLEQLNPGQNAASERVNGPTGDTIMYGVGVRALVGGAWGFAASPYWEPDEVVRLAHDAVAQAKSNAVGGFSPADLGKIPVATGSWSTPVRIDPFTVPIEEREEILGSWVELSKQAYRGARRFQRGRGAIKSPLGAGALFHRQELAVATTDGAYFTQTTYRTAVGFSYRLTDLTTDRSVSVMARKNLGFVGAGWEVVLDAGLPDQLPGLVETAQELLATPIRPGQVGRYDVVFDAASMASIVNATVGTPTQLDRALGFEANAGGTSYLSDPLHMLGTQQVGSTLLTVTANRSLPKGLATVKWDDEGVEPDDFTLVKNGILADYQTTREQAAWLAPYYQAHNQPVRSHGCAAADSALGITMQHSPNLALAPGLGDVTLDDLVRNTARGFAITDAGVSMDFQGRTGFGSGAVREIVNGRLGQQVAGLSFSFTTTELLKNIMAIGGRASIEHLPSGGVKGQPLQSRPHTVSAVPAKISNMTFVDPSRKA